MVRNWHNYSVVAADTHLAPYAWKSAPTISGDSYFSFQQIVDACIEHNACELLLAGDVIDRVTVDPLTMQFLAQQCERLRASNIPVKFVVGQHERHRLAQWLNVHPWPQHVHATEWDSPSGHWYGLDWEMRDTTQQSLEAMPVADCLLTHHVWQNLGGDIMHPECAAVDVRHASLVVTGDYHKHVLLETHNHQNQPMLMLSPGSTVMQSIDEPPTKYFAIVGPNRRIERIKLKTRSCIRYKLENPEDVDWLVEQELPVVLAEGEEQWATLPTSIRTPVVAVEYSADWPRAYATLREAISPFAHFFARPRRSSSEVVTITNKQLQSLSLHTGLVSGIDLVASPDEPHYRDLHKLLVCPRDQAALDDVITDIVDRVAASVTPATE